MPECPWKSAALPEAGHGQQRLTGLSVHTVDGTLNTLPSLPQKTASRGTLSLITFPLVMKCCRVLVGVPWEWGKVGATSVTQASGQIETTSSVYSRRGSLVPLNLPQGRRSTELASAEVTWSLSIGHRHLSSDSAGRPRLGIRKYQLCVLLLSSRPAVRPIGIS